MKKTYTVTAQFKNRDKAYQLASRASSYGSEDVQVKEVLWCEDEDPECHIIMCPVHG